MVPLQQSVHTVPDAGDTLPRWTPEGSIPAGDRGTSQPLPSPVSSPQLTSAQEGLAGLGELVGCPTPTAPLLGPRQSPRGDRRGGPGSPPQLRVNSKCCYGSAAAGDFVILELKQQNLCRVRGSRQALGRPGEKESGGRVCVTGGDAGFVTSRVCSEG